LKRIWTNWRKTLGKAGADEGTADENKKQANPPGSAHPAGSCCASRRDCPRPTSRENGMGRPMWHNIETGFSRIGIDAAMNLCDTYHITLD
jgi:hypothetical protein